MTIQRPNGQCGPTGIHHDKCWILGVPISVITIDSAIDEIRQWVSRGESRYVCVSDVHNLMLAQTNAAHMNVLRGADMITPDGAPLVATARMRGEKRMGRVPGPDFMPAALERARAFGWKHFFLGGADGVPEALAKKMSERFPDLAVVGAASPPFRPLTDEEDAALVAQILASGCNILWVGLGCPKQEAWMAAHRSLLPGVIAIGVGAAFGFHSGEVARAPRLMSRMGLEWLHRLISNPKRLWRRYLIMAPKFVVASLAETISIRLARPRAGSVNAKI